MAGSKHSVNMRILKLKARLQLDLWTAEVQRTREQIILFKALSTVLCLHAWEYGLLTLYTFWYKQHFEEARTALSSCMWLGAAGCQCHLKDIQSSALLLL